MNTAFIILWMVFFHIVDDYYLQKVGILAMMKQRSWWEKEAPQKMYRYDYLVALLMHSFSWAFMVMLPIAMLKSFDIGIDYLVWFLINVCVHALTDDLKANRKLINLWQDQIVHLIQIVVAALFLI